TTHKAITVPYEKDTLSACGRIVRADCVVRTLVLVAIRIPMLHANAEKSAPNTKATTISQWVDSTNVDTTKRAMAAMTTKIIRMRYSACRKAKAPSWMLFEMRCIR